MPAKPPPATEPAPVEEIAAGILEAASLSGPAIQPAPLDVVGQSELDANFEILSANDLAEIRAVALKQFQKERRDAARAVAIKSELSRLERTHGKRMLGGHLDDMVAIVLNIPESGDKFGGRMIIDQEIFQNGQRIVRPRHVINSILETMWRGQLAEYSLTGKKREEFYRQQRPVEVSKVGFQVHEGLDVVETVRVA